jgi:hypothetical protein
MAARVCSATRYSMELRGTSAHGADVDCSGYIVRGCVAQRGELSRDARVCMGICVKLAPYSTARVKTVIRAKPRLAERESRECHARR